MENHTSIPDDSAGSADEPANEAPHAHSTARHFRPFRSGVLDVLEEGEEVVVTKQVWTTEELVFTKRVTARTAVVPDSLRTVDVGAYSPATPSGGRDGQ